MTAYTARKLVNFYRISIIYLLFYFIHCAKHTNTRSGKVQSSLILQRMVYIFTTGLAKVLSQCHLSSGLLHF